MFKSTWHDEFPKRGMSHDFHPRSVLPTSFADPWVEITYIEVMNIQGGHGQGRMMWNATNNQCRVEIDTMITKHRPCLLAMLPRKLSREQALGASDQFPSLVRHHFQVWNDLPPMRTLDHVQKSSEQIIRKLKNHHISFSTLVGSKTPPLVFSERMCENRVSQNPVVHHDCPNENDHLLWDILGLHPILQTHLDES